MYQESVLSVIFDPLRVAPAPLFQFDVTFFDHDIVCGEHPGAGVQIEAAGFELTLARVMSVAEDDGVEAAAAELFGGLFEARVFADDAGAASS